MWDLGCKVRILPLNGAANPAPERRTAVGRCSSLTPRNASPAVTAQVTCAHVAGSPRLASAFLAGALNSYAPSVCTPPCHPTCPSQGSRGWYAALA